MRKWTMGAAVIFCVGLVSGGCAQEAMPEPVAAAVGISEHEVSRPLVIEVGIERAGGEKVVGTKTQLDLNRPVHFSARAADGSDIEIELLVEEGDGSGKDATYRVAFSVAESDDSGKKVVWQPALRIAAGKDVVTTMHWGSEERTLRVHLAEEPRVAAR